MEEESEINLESYIPDRLCGIEIGDVLTFRPLLEIHRDNKSRLIALSWNTQMDELYGKEIVINDSIMLNIDRKIPCICQMDGWSISLSMLEFKDKKEEQKEKKETMADDKINFSIVRDIDKKIIDEMISKVDYKRLKKLMLIGSDGNASDEQTHSFLQEWAHAKYDFYLLLGRNLLIETDMEAEMSRDEMRNLVEEKLFKKFPHHYAILSRFDMIEFIENKITRGNIELSTYCGDMYKLNKKLSKFISEYCQDKDLNDSLANVLGNRKIISKVAISIDPYDYMTMSLNNHRWSSCQKIGEGEWATAPLSLMIDSTTMIGFKYSGEDVKYKYHNYEFMGNSKTWRECVYYDRDTSSVIFSRQYPDEINSVSELLRKMIEDIVSEYLGVKNIWKIKHNKSEEFYEEGSQLLYHDVAQGAGTNCLIVNKECSDKPHFVVGKDYNCLSCGKHVDSSGQYFLCYDCSDEEYDDEEDDEEEDE